MLNNTVLVQPDKISLSSQDTISIHSSSTNCDEDEDKIAIRIKRKKHRKLADGFSGLFGDIRTEFWEYSFKFVIWFHSSDITD